LPPNVGGNQVYFDLYALLQGKAPWPYGFQPILFKTFCHSLVVYASNVYHLLSSAFDKSPIFPKLTETLIVFIPKVYDPSTLKDFKLTSPYNVLLTECYL
jgi:hypothetical protein